MNPLARWWRLLRLAAQLASLALRRGSWGAPMRARLAGELVAATYTNLWWFTLVSALAALVVTRIVVVTALSYGLSRYALEMVVRVLVLELIPLAAAFFVAVRYTLPAGRAIAAQRPPGQALAALEVLPPVLAGGFAVLTLAAASGVVVLLLAYVVVHGLSPWAWASYTRTVGQVLSPAVALIFVAKTLLFAAAVAVIPAASALTEDPGPARAGPELQGLFRMLAVMVLVELGSLMVNYY